MGKKGFKSSKCTGLLKMTVSRIKLLKNKREIQCRQHKQDIAMLLRKGQQHSASVRVEHVFKEQNILDAYFLIEGFCYLVTERMVAIEKQKTCPNDLKEAIASLIFSAPRCADLPELQEVRSMFTAKYGQEFSTAAVELHPDSGVNRQIIEKLSTLPPSTDIKLWLLKEVAAENGVDWDPEKAKDVLKPTKDLLGGPQHFAGSQIKQNPSDGARQDPEPENAKYCIESNKSLSSRNVSQFASVSQLHSVLPAAYPDHMSENEQKKLPVASQGYTRPPSAEKYDSRKCKEKPVNSASVVGIVNSKNSEENPYNRLRKEGKMDYHVDKEVMDCTSGYQQFPSEHDAHHSFTKFTREDENSINLTQVKIKYEDAATAAEAAFQSAAYAAEAAKAAVSLANHESYDNESTQSENNQREADLDSELDEALEAALARSIRILGSDCEDNSSARTGEVFSTKNSRTRKCETNYVSYHGSGSETVHSTQMIATNPVGEETSKAQVSSSRAKKYSHYKYAQQHFKDCHHDADEDKFSTFHKNRKLHVKQEDLEGSEMQSRRSMPLSALSLINHSSSSKATSPVFDDYDGDECKHIYSGSTRPKSMSNAAIITEKNVFDVLSASDVTTIPKSNKNSHCAKSSRRQKEKQHNICENEMHPDNSRSEMSPVPGKGLEAEGEVKITRQKAKTRLLKPSFKDFVRQETRSFEELNLQSDEGTVSSNNFERMKFQYQRKASSLKSSYPEYNKGVYKYNGDGEAWQGCGTVEGISENDRASQSLPKVARSNSGFVQSSNSGFEQSVEMPDNYVSSNISKQRILENSLQSKHDNEWHNEEVDSSIGCMRHDKAIHCGESCKSVRNKQKSRGPQTTRNKEKETEFTNVGYATFDNPSHISSSSLLSYKTSSRAKMIYGSMSNSSPFMTPTPTAPLFAADTGEIQKQTLNSSTNKPPSEYLYLNPSRHCTDEEFSERLAALRRKH